MTTQTTDPPAPTTRPWPIARTHATYPMSQPMTVQQVEKLLAVHGLITFRCDDAVIDHLPPTKEPA